MTGSKLITIMVAVLAMRNCCFGQQDETTVARRPLGMPAYEMTDEAPLDALETLRRSAPFFVEHLQALTPGQTTAVWIGLVGLLLFAWNWRRIFSIRNVVLVLLFLPAFLYFDLDTQSTKFGDVVAWSRFRLIAATLMGTHVLTLLWASFARLQGPDDVESPMPIAATRALAIIFLGMTLMTALGGEGADSTIYTNIGTQRMRERGKLPYGDPWLARGNAAAYGPGMYLMTLPAQILIDREPLNEAVDLPATYRMGRGLPARATTAVLIVAAFFALVALGKRLGTRPFAWTLAAATFSSAYVLGVGSEVSTLVGAMNLSDTSPLAFMLLAFVWLERRPLLAGLALAQATACGFFPVLLFLPAALWRHRQGPGVAWFAAGYALLGLAYLGLLFGLIETTGDENALDVFIDCTFSHQQRPNDLVNMKPGYGDSPFGFWGSYPNLRQAVLGTHDEPKIWGWVFLGGVLVVACLRARRGSLRVLLAVSGALALAVQLLRIHASGVHAMWFFPLMLAALLAPAVPLPETDEAAATSVEI